MTTRFINMSARKRVLVGTLFCGESEYSLCIASLKQQLNVEFDSFVIENRPNKEAHDALYFRFMSASEGYDYFFKFDADMVFTTKDALAGMIDLVSRNSAAHMLIDVFDWPSQLSIPGAQMFRSDSKWLGSAETLDVDYPPQLSGLSIRIADPKPQLINHMPKPSEHQMFRYGIHKALKCVQPNRKNKILGKGIIHTTILVNIARHWRSTHDNLLIWALIGSMLLFEGKLQPIVDDYAGSNSKRLFDDIKNDQAKFQSLASEADRYWRNEIQSYLRLQGLFPHSG
ncbi:MAG TPA: hypothetical protein VJ800_12460 [Pseudolabrys sp.]|nr:hypothetical protein [Pseudolabrys sp.]